MKLSVASNRQKKYILKHRKKMFDWIINLKACVSACVTMHVPCMCNCFTRVFLFYNVVHNNFVEVMYTIPNVFVQNRSN